jgi:uncharacterized membrane protein
MAIVYNKNVLVLGVAIAFVLVVAVGGVVYWRQSRPTPLVALPRAQEYIPEPVMAPSQEPLAQASSTVSSSKPVAAPVVAPPCSDVCRSNGSSGASNRDASA